MRPDSIMDKRKGGIELSHSLAFLLVSTMLHASCTLHYDTLLPTLHSDGMDLPEQLALPREARNRPE